MHRGFAMNTLSRTLIVALAIVATPWLAARAHAIPIASPVSASMPVTDSLAAAVSAEV